MIVDELSGTLFRKDILTDLKDIRRLIAGFELVRYEPIRAKDGGFTPLYVDVKGAYGDPNKLVVLTAGLVHLLDDDVTCVAACGYGGIPLAVSVSLQLRCRLTLIRERPKAHGKGEVLEGYLPSSIDRVAVVDDKVVTGGTIAVAMRKIEETGALVTGGYVVVNIGDTIPHRIHPLITLRDLLSGRC